MQIIIAYLSRLILLFPVLSYSRSVVQKLSRIQVALCYVKIKAKGQQSSSQFINLSSVWQSAMVDVEEVTQLITSSPISEIIVLCTPIYAGSPL